MLRITAEWKRAKTVIMHEPGIEMFYGILNPDSFLYMRHFNITKAVAQHRNLQETLKQLGIEVIKLKDTITQKTRNKEFEKIFQETALKYIRFEGDANVEEERREFEKNVDSLDPETLFNIILLNPTVILHKSLGTSEYTPRIINEEPLANLYFIRDPAIVTNKGAVIGRMSKRIRQRETELVKLLFLALSENPIKEVSEPAYLEGGDYMPFDDFVIVGTGERTTVSGILQISDVLEFNEIVIVYNPEIESTNDYMLTMHLDMYLNTPKEGIVVGNANTLKKALANVFIKDERGNLILKRKTTLYDYLKTKKYKLIEITLSEQLAYAANFLTIDNGKIITPTTEDNIKHVIKYIESRNYKELEQIIKYEYSSLQLNKAFFPNKKEIKEEGIEAIEVDVSELTGGFGGIHCMTLPIRRM